MTDYPFRSLIDALPTRRDVPFWATRKSHEIHLLVLHHSATAIDTSPEQINQFHQSRDWPRASYHYMVSHDGTVWKVNRNLEITWGAAKHNTPAIHLCLIGHFAAREVPFDQWRSAVLLGARLLTEYPIRLDRVVGHGQLSPPHCPVHGATCPGSPTACPGAQLSLTRFRADLAAQLKAPA